jgi:hypothetical protein
MHAACVVLSAARVLLFGADPVGDAPVLASRLLAVPRAPVCTLQHTAGVLVQPACAFAGKPPPPNVLLQLVELCCCQPHAALCLVGCRCGCCVHPNCPDPLWFTRCCRACCCWGPCPIYFCSHTRPAMSAHLFFLPLLNLVFIPPPSNSSVCVGSVCASRACQTPCVQYMCSRVAHNDIEMRRNACCFLLVQVLILVLLEAVGRCFLLPVLLSAV